MRKLIGTVVIIGVVYAGFFGIDKFGISPFIKEWISDGGIQEAKENVSDLAEDLRNAAMKIDIKNNGIKEIIGTDDDIHENVHEAEESENISDNNDKIINIYSSDDDALEIFDSEDIDTVKVVIEDLSNYDDENH